MKNYASSLAFIESPDPGTFGQYVDLRRRVFHQRYAGLPLDFGFADDADRSSYIVYAMQGGALAGGARLTISTPERPRELPLESSAFRLRESYLWNELGLGRQPYAEISRMAVDPACSDGLAVSCGLGRELCQISARHGVDLIFSICPKAAARLNRLNARACGVEYCIYGELPTVFGITMSLCAYSGVLKAAKL